MLQPGMQQNQIAAMQQKKFLSECHRTFSGKSQKKTIGIRQPLDPLQSGLPALPQAGDKVRFRIRIILIGLLALAICAPVGYSMLRPYHKARIHVFLNPGSDPLNKGWNQMQSELAVGSGGLTGKGFMQGTQNQLGYLPQTVSNSDFIFSVIAEETGFVGSVLLLGMYALLMISIFRTALIASDDFGRYLCTGIGAVFALHTIVNIGMSIRLMPVTGLPLPLVSYGGTFMLATLSCLGMVQSVYANRSRTEVER